MIWGDGDFATKLGLNSNFNSIFAVLDDIETLDSQISSTQNADTGLMEDDYSRADKYYNFQSIVVNTPASSISWTDYEEIFEAVLDPWTSAEASETQQTRADFVSGTCEVKDDLFRFTEDDCEAKSGYTYTYIGDSANADNYGNCLSMQTRSIYSGVSLAESFYELEWDENQMCIDYKTETLAQYDKVEAFYKDIVSTLSEVMSSFEEIDTKRTNLKADILSHYNEMDSVKIVFNEISDVFHNETNGVNQQMDCRFFSYAILLVTETMCTEIQPGLHTIEILCITAAYANIIGAWVICITARCLKKLPDRRLSNSVAPESSRTASGSPEQEAPLPIRDKAPRSSRRRHHDPNVSEAEGLNSLNETRDEA